MRCPQCNTELPAESEFCHQCGTRVRATCERCGALTSAGSRFCHRCGAELAQVDTGPASQTSAESARGRAASALATGCPRCRTINEPGSAYCYKCGLPFEGTRVQRVPSPAGSQAYAGEPAGFWIRFAAYLLDSIVLLVVTIIIGVIAFTGAATDGKFGLSDYIGYVIGIAYFTIFVALWRTTAGKRLLRLYVVRTDGSRLGPGRSLARSLAYVVSTVPFLLGFVMIGVREDKRGLHDLICDTQVVRVPASQP